MQGISAVAWLSLLILIAGVSQTWAPPRNGTLRNSLIIPRLASLVSLLPIVALFGLRS